MQHVLPVVTGTGETDVSICAPKDVQHSVHSQMDLVHRAVTGFGGTVVSRRAQTANVASQMENVCNAMIDTGAETAPRLAVLLAHQPHVI